MTQSNIISLPAIWHFNNKTKSWATFYKTLTSLHHDGIVCNKTFCLFSTTYTCTYRLPPENLLIDWYLWNSLERLCFGRFARIEAWVMWLHFTVDTTGTCYIVAQNIIYFRYIKHERNVTKILITAYIILVWC